MLKSKLSFNINLLDNYYIVNICKLKMQWTYFEIFFTTVLFLFVNPSEIMQKFEGVWEEESWNMSNLSQSCTVAV